MGSEDNSIDIFGIKPIADSVNTVTKAAVEGASAFLSRICLPAAEEFGLLLKDKVSFWRTRNTIKIVRKAEELLNKSAEAGNKHAHPRLIFSIIEKGAWADVDEVQGMWSGLLASSCTEGGTDESNLIFINILSQLTSSQCLILNYSCKTAEKRISKAGWITAEYVPADIAKLQEITAITDLHRIDRELDHLRSLQLIFRGFLEEDLLADLTPTSLALHMYVRCQGYIGSPIEFFGLHDETDGMHTPIGQ